MSYPGYPPSSAPPAYSAHPPAQNPAYGAPAQPGYPGAPAYGAPAGYPPQGGQPGYPPQGGQPGYPPQGGQPGYPPQGGQPGYPGSQPGYPGSQPGYPPAAYPPAGQQGYPGAQPGYGAPAAYPPQYPPASPYGAYPSPYGASPYPSPYPAASPYPSPYPSPAGYPAPYPAASPYPVAPYAAAAYPAAAGYPVAGAVAMVAGVKYAVQLRGSRLDRKDLLSKSDPFITVSASRNPYGVMTQKEKKEGKVMKKGGGSSGNWAVVYRTETVRDCQNPVWQPFTVDLNTLCAGNIERPIKIECWDFDPNGNHDFIGSAQTSIREMQVMKEVRLVNKHRVGISNTAGILEVLKCSPA